MPDATSESPEGRRLGELDGLRGLAILLVLIVHYVVAPEIAPQTSHPAAYLRRAFVFAWSGVDLFFVLSGFLIGGILLDRRGSPSYFSTFYIRRFWRIVPLYALVCAVFIAGLLLAVPSRWPQLQWLYSLPIPIPALLTFTQNFWLPNHPRISPFLGPTWSLAVEEHFYLTLPLLIRLVKPARLPAVLASVIALSPLVRFAVVGLWMKHPLAAYMYTFCRADALAWGVLAAIAIRSPAWRALLVRHVGWLYAAFSFFLAGVAFMTQRNWKAYRFTPLAAAGVYSWMAMFYVSLLLVAVAAPSGPFARVLRLWPLRRLGILAYGLYLFHLPVQFICYGLLRGSPPSVVSWSDFGIASAALALTVVLAHISWTYFERPLLRRGHAYHY